ncbi:MAG TPA: LCP family protein [Ktedonobacterales bacterium]|jgi:LCP family protein required for cell wall assembly
MDNTGLSPHSIQELPTENHPPESSPPLVRRPASPPEEPGRRKAPHKRRKIILITVASVFLLTLLGGAALAVVKYYGVYQLVQSSTGQTLPKVVSTNQPVQATQLPGDLSNVDHFNLLLLGSDNDQKFHSGAVLTQTDIVVRVDLAHQKVTMVSIPRDMWLPSDQGKCCYKLDEISGAETDGATTPQERKLHGFAHTVATIEANFHIPIDAYAWVGLDGFVKVIDTLGGVDVDVLHPVVDDAYPKDLDPNGNPFDYQRLYIPAGPQHLNGVEALNYVRSRHSDLLGDFGRSARQQSVLIALKKKLDSGTLLNRLDELAKDLQGSVLTSLTLGQMVSLANFAKNLHPTDFQQYVLGVPEYGYYDQLEGKSIVQPIWSAINQTIHQIFP